MELQTIDSLCSLISSGGTPSRKRPDFYTDESDGHLWVKSKELLDRSIEDTEEKITDEGLNTSSAKYFPEDTVLIAMYGANVCQLGWLKRPATVNQAVCGLVVNKEIASSRFVFYALLQTREALAARAQGAAQQNLNQGLIREFRIPSPPLPTQRKIAAILSAYDDLIENNLRRIKILEEMAQNLYREWFIKFRFPGHQHARFTDSPLGRIPEGWEVNTVENTFAILGGGTPSKTVPEYWDEGIINWYSPTDLTATGSMFMERSGNQISELGLKKSSARLFPPFSVMMTSRATLGVISINTTEACTNQGFITCVPNERFPLYTLYYWLKGNVEYFTTLGTGATFKEITKGVFKTIELVVPTPAIVTQFEDTVQTFALQVLNLQRKNITLRRTRDLLLPRLISGEVDVSELDIAIPEEAEV
jgi:type I restriction enzyme S subunit